MNIKRIEKKKSKSINEVIGFINTLLSMRWFSLEFSEEIKRGLG